MEFSTPFHSNRKITYSNPTDPDDFGCVLKLSIWAFRQYENYDNFSTGSKVVLNYLQNLMKFYWICAQFAQFFSSKLHPNQKIFESTDSQHSLLHFEYKFS
jgi:hypothetical protein